MTARAPAAVLWLALLGLPLTASVQTPPAGASALAGGAPLTAEIDAILSDPTLARALVAMRVERLRDGRLLYARNPDALVMPGSNMKIVTLAVAADILGLDYRFETRVEAAGQVTNGTLHGDLIVTGTGDPSIGSPDDGHAPLLLAWAERLQAAGIRRIEGRLIGDDNAFDDRDIGAGWAWDYQGYGYAAPAGALNYNENAAALRIVSGATDGAPASVRIGPPGHQLELDANVTTTAPGTQADLTLERFPGRPTLVVRGTVPRADVPVFRSAAVNNPTVFFVEALRLALASRGVEVTGGAWDIDDLPVPFAGVRRLIVVHQSPPLSTLAGYAMGVSQNQYAEVFLKAVGRATGGTGSTDAGRRAVLATLGRWGVPADALVIYDGSGLSRYNYVTASAIVAVLAHVWRTESLRGAFTAWLPVAGAPGGTLALRMRNSPLTGTLQGKTGSISNARALSGYLRLRNGEPAVFSAMVNHFTAPAGQIDALVERALERVATVPPPD